MQNVTTSIDQNRIAVQRNTSELYALSPEATLKRCSVKRGDTLGKCTLAKEVSRINCPISRASPRGQRVIHNHTATLKRCERRLALAVRNEINQVQLLQRR